MFSWCCLGYMVVVSVLWCFCWWYNGWSDVMMMLMGCCYGLTWQYMMLYISYLWYTYICIHFDIYILYLWYISILQFLGWTFYVFFPNGSRNCCFVSVRKTQAMSQTQWAINRVEILSCFTLVERLLNILPNRGNLFEQIFFFRNLMNGWLNFRVVKTVKIFQVKPLKKPKGGFLTLWCEVEAVLEFDHESILPCT